MKNHQKANKWDSIYPLCPNPPAWSQALPRSKSSKTITETIQMLGGGAGAWGSRMMGGPGGQPRRLQRTDEPQQQAGSSSSTFHFSHRKKAGILGIQILTNWNWWRLRSPCPGNSKQRGAWNAKTHSPVSHNYTLTASSDGRQRKACVSEKEALQPFHDYYNDYAVLYGLLCRKAQLDYAGSRHIENLRAPDTCQSQQSGG